MTAAALLDLGASRGPLERALRSLPVDGFSVAVSRVKKSGRDVCDVDVRLDAAHENHDHDMEYLFGGGRQPAVEHGEGHEHACDHGHVHDHDGHGHGHDGHDPSHPHEQGNEGDPGNPLPGGYDGAGKSHGGADLYYSGGRGGGGHGVDRSRVHFHEVGAVDSIVDIVTAAVCLDDLDVTEVIVPYLCEGNGMVRCQHGLIPIPVPAVVNIAQAHGLTLKPTDIQGELVTPTGAAIAAAIRTSDRLPERFTIERVGLGAGKRQYERPSILRAMLIADASAGSDEICKLETNIDDCTGETLGYVMERLFEAGARDVHYTPVFMKKNRPAWQLNVICDPKDRESMEKIIFAETTTIGIRRVNMQRTVLERECVRISTPLGEADVKLCRSAGTEKAIRNTTA